MGGGERVKRISNRDFVGNYEKLRSVLRDIFIYGCFSRTDFEYRGISSRKYDNEKRKILGFLDNSNITEQIENKKKYVRMSSNMFNTTTNYLIDSFRTKSFTNLDIELYLKIMQLLSCHPGGLDENKISAMIENYNSEMPQERYNHNTVYRKLTELCGIGILKSTYKGKNLYYAVADDILKHLSDSELRNLAQAVKFYKNTFYPCTPGYYLSDTLKQYMQIEQSCNEVQADMFMFKHCHFQHVLDDEAVWQLIIAVNKASLIRFEYRKFDSIEWIVNQDVIPHKIIIDELYGRRFLCAFKETNLIPIIFRIDRMRFIKETGTKPAELDLDTIYDEHMQFCWCASPLKRDLGLFKVELIFTFTPENEPYMVKRIKDGGKWGELRKLGDCRYLYAIDVTDPREMKPWIRTFMGFVEVIKSDRHQLREEFLKELEVWAQNYEAI